MANAREVSECRLCGGVLSGPVLALGAQPISNRLPKASENPPRLAVYPLDIVLCDECGLPQLAHNLDASEHFHDDYTYLSGASSNWVAHCRSYAERLTSVHGISENDFVVEAGSNDGTLLKALSARGVRVLGIEPSGNVADIARRNGADTLTAFLDADTATRIRSEYGAPRALVGNNVLAHVPDTHGFLCAARDLVADEGFLCFEFPHFTNILQRRYFDTIYHEHYVYLGVGPLLRWANENAMELYDVERQPTHGGSLRVFLRRRVGPPRAPPASVKSILDDERLLAGPGPWRDLGLWLAGWRRDFRAMIDGFREEGRSIAGYAAASKATVICNFLGLTNGDIAYCCDASPLKQGRIIPGTGIPIVAPDVMKNNPPDIVLVFAWNIFDEITGIVAGLIRGPVTIVRPLPEIEVQVHASRATG
jgi:SAM-dependent methyltransferase